MLASLLTHGPPTTTIAKIDKMHSNLFKALHIDIQKEVDYERI